MGGKDWGESLKGLAICKATRCPVPQSCTPTRLVFLRKHRTSWQLKKGTYKYGLGLVRPGGMRVLDVVVVSDVFLF